MFYIPNRAVMVSETENLTGLSELWKSRFDDTSIPEESKCSSTNYFIYYGVNQHPVHTLKCVSLCSRSKRPDAHCCGSGQTADERTIRSV